jgi:hypothetical protein
MADELEELLKDGSIDPNMRKMGTTGHTMLFDAVNWRCIDCVAVLMRHGADPFMPCLPTDTMRAEEVTAAAIEAVIAAIEAEVVRDAAVRAAVAAAPPPAAVPVNAFPSFEAFDSRPEDDETGEDDTYGGVDSDAERAEDAEAGAEMQLFATPIQLIVRYQGYLFWTLATLMSPVGLFKESDVNQVDAMMIHAVTEMHAHTAHELLSLHEANVEAVDENGMTALAHAVEGSLVDIAEMLVTEFGAVPVFDPVAYLARLPVRFVAMDPRAYGPRVQQMQTRFASLQERHADALRLRYLKRALGGWSAAVFRVGSATRSLKKK